MWQTKYALAVPKNLGVGVNFRPCSEGCSSLGVRNPCQKPIGGLCIRVIMQQMNIVKAFIKYFITPRQNIYLVIT